MKKIILFIIFVLANNLMYSQSWDFTSADYQSTDFTQVGNSYWIDDAGLNPSKRMRLVALYTGLQGSFWLNSKTINPSLKWSASFTADINYGSTPDADGLAFTIQPTGTAANGNIYYGAYNANALSVSIITYTTNLINVYANNSTTPKGSVSASLVGFTPFNVTVSYAPTTTTLSVALSQAGGPNVSYDVDIDLANELGTTADFTIGFSAQTGASANNHGIHNFAFDEQIIFVNSSSSGNNDGTSWNDAFTSLQSALDAAVSGDEIWVAEGTYKPSVDDAGQINADERRHTFQMKNGVGIYGGFAGTETSTTDRQIGANETILSGERGGAGASDNCYNVFYHPNGLGLTNSAVLDGFTITKGYMGSYPYRDGAAMYNDGSSPTIINCKVLNNRSYNGGGFFFKNASSPKITNTVFVSNIAYFGGGIYNQGTSELEVINCTFTGNDGGAWGGAIENVATSLTAKNCIFWDNTAVGENSSEIYNSSTKTAAFYNCNVKGGVTNINSNATDGGGNINSDPKFAGSGSYPYSIAGNSPCIDNGTNSGVTESYDIRGYGFSRTQNSTIDMGAYEYKSGTDPTGSTIFVDIDASSGTNSGVSWTNAFNTASGLQSALDIAIDADQIWVAEGTYKPSSAYGLTNSSRFYHFEMIEDVEIYGGFAGTESATSQRVNFGVDEVNETILSGDIGTTGTDTDNCYHVFYYSGNTLTTNAVLDGFTVTKGYANGSSTHGYGGGIYNAYSYFKNRNCAFTDNYASNGGGIYINQCNGFIVENCVFSDNEASSGGGVFLYLGSNHTFTNTIFSENSSNTYGGGLYILNSTPASLNNCLFEGNTAISFGGGCRIDGSEPTITNCTFTNNSTVDASGGGAVFINSDSDVTITNSIVWGNTSNGIENEIYMGMGGLRTVTYSDIRGRLVLGTGNINVNPVFADVGNNDYRISGFSPCVNVGNNSANTQTYDIRGEARIQETTIDMGAYEYTSGADPVAASISWNAGANTSDWNTSGNWNANVVPTSDYNVVIPDLATDPVIAYNKTADCNNLTVDGGATLTIESDASGTGSLIVGGSSSGNVTIERYVTQDLWHYVSAPVAGQLINDPWMSNNSIVNTPPYQFFRWDEDNNYWIIYGSTGTPEAFTDTEFITAKGYALTSSASSDLSFTGTIRTSDVTYPATYTADNGEGFNIVGNPFASAIGVNSSAESTTNFLAENTDVLDNSFEAIYVWDEQAVWDGSRDDYKIIGSSIFGSYTSLGQDYINSGQSFMVKVNSGGGDIVFKESMQSHQNATTYHKDSEEQWPFVELVVQNQELFNSTAIGFNTDMTIGLDPSYDVAKMKGNPDIALYTKLVSDNGLDFALQALPEFNIEENEIPVGIDILEPTTLEFLAIKNKLENYKVILEDRLENTQTDLGKGNYITEVSQSGTGRFFVTFTDAVSVNEFEENSNIRFWNYNNNIYIANPDLEKGSLSIFNLLGQKIVNTNLTGDANQQFMVNSPSGYYIVNIITNKGVVNEKVYLR